MHLQAMSLLGRWERLPAMRTGPFLPHGREGEQNQASPPPPPPPTASRAGATCGGNEMLSALPINDPSEGLLVTITCSLELSFLKFRRERERS